MPTGGVARTSLHHNLRRRAADILLEPYSHILAFLPSVPRRVNGASAIPAHDMSSDSDSDCWGYQAGSNGWKKSPLYQYHRAKAVNGVKLRVGRSRFLSQCKAESLPYGCGGARLSHHRMRLRHWAELFLRLYFGYLINGGNGKTWSVRFSETFIMAESRCLC
jgi:hypothetical protein